MKKLTILLTSAAIVLSCFIGICTSAADMGSRILKLISDNPVDVSVSSDNLGLMSEEDAKLNEIRRVSDLYAVSTEIVSMSVQMTIDDYMEIEKEVNQYIMEVASADEKLDTSGMSNTDEYKELISNRTILNETIDMQPPQIIKVDNIYPDKDFWVRVHVMYKSDSNREFSLRMTNYTTGEVVATKTGTIYSGSYNSDVKLNAAGCSRGDEISITVIYKGVTYSVFEECTFTGYVLEGTATAAPTAEPKATMEPKTTITPEPTENIDIKSVNAYESTKAASGTSVWSNAEVTAAIEMGLVPQKLQGGYTEYISREGFCDLAARAIEKYSGISITEYASIYGTNEASFIDTSEEVINACAVLGIVNGFEDGTFRPNYVITREQAAAMLARCARKLGLSDKPGIFIFNDNESISGWARGHVRYVRANEIMNGDDDNNFMPHMSYTVEQAIITFYRMYNKL
ncbi:MAG: S-layer homology domain-containing protein [Candidatus Ornithomonoglobus sp.]